MTHGTASAASTFDGLFTALLGERPFAWQRAVAQGEWPEVLIAPTGSGKTAGVTLAWAHRRLLNPDTTPSRLVWCLPMRTLVDQASEEIRRWLSRLEEHRIDPDNRIPRADAVHVLMGGVDSGDWLRKPERPSILVGTQDMLLSRALLRGYATSRALWPMEFALLHQDTQWVFDEVQLMGAGRATSAQLEAFRRQERRRADRHDRTAVGRPCRSLWISATLEPEWLRTVDHPVPTRVMRVDPAQQGDNRLRALAHAPKHLHRASATPESASAQHEKEYVAGLAESVVTAHRTGSMTLAIVNQVKRAQALHTKIRGILDGRDQPTPALALLHSRFRPADRKREMGKVLNKVGNRGKQADVIVIATQAVEAGVDISAAVMVTELAPWASMVQRFGRANRRAEVPEGANVCWVDLLERVTGNEPAARKQATELSRPYLVDELRESRERLAGLRDVAPAHLPGPGPIAAPLRVIRRKDLHDLFDTDSDLTGFDVDISPYVRDAEDTDIRIFWRELTAPREGTDDGPTAPGSEELCAVPIGQARKWIRASRKKAARTVFFVRDPQWRRREEGAASHPPGWVPFHDEPWPGLTLLADVAAGGYSDELGFTGVTKHCPDPVSQDAPADGASDGHDGDPRSEASRPVRLADHLRHVSLESSALTRALGLDDQTSTLLTRAARWHDLGKAHEVFQDTMRRGLNGHEVPEGDYLAKTVKSNLRHGRAYFRHELASALAFLSHRDWSREADLTAYLIAAHHGKVRMNLRALPRESGPAEPERRNARFARGVWQGDELPPLELPGNEEWEGGALTLSIMELGWDKTTRESWTERTRELLARHGPFELAWLETLLRIADWRASAKEASGEYGDV